MGFGVRRQNRNHQARYRRGIDRTGRQEVQEARCVRGRIRKGDSAEQDQRQNDCQPVRKLRDRMGGKVDHALQVQHQEPAGRWRN